MAWTLDTLCHKKNSWMGSFMATRHDGHGADTTAAAAVGNWLKFNVNLLKTCVSSSKIYIIQQQGNNAFLRNAA